MAYFYWTGKEGTDPNNRFNWTTFAGNCSAGATWLPTPATRAPGTGDIINFTRFTVGVTTYPVTSPTGTMYNGVITGSTAIANLSQVYVYHDSPVGLGTGSTYFNFYANNVYLNKGATNYSNLLFNINMVGNSATNVLITSYSDPSNPANNNFIVNAQGWGKIYNNPQIIIPTYGTIRFGNNYVGKVGPFLNVAGREKIYLSRLASLDPSSPIDVKGVQNSVYIEKGFQTAENSPLRMSYNGDSSQLVEFSEEDFSYNFFGVTGPSETDRSTVKLTLDGISTTTQTVNVRHGVDFTDLTLRSGTVNFNNDPNQTCRIFEGVAYTGSSLINISNPENVIFMNAISGSYDGFFIRNTGSPLVSGTFPIKLNTGGAMRILLTADVNSSDHT